MVDLPEPDGPSKATISPLRTCRSMPRRTSIVAPPWVKLRRRPRTSSTSVMGHHRLPPLDGEGLGRGGLVRRVPCWWRLHPHPALPHRGGGLGRSSLPHS